MIDEKLKEEVYRLADELKMSPEELRFESFCRAAHPQIAKASIQELECHTWGMEQMTERDWRKMKATLQQWLKPKSVDDWYYHICYYESQYLDLIMDYLSMVFVDYVDDKGHRHYGINRLQDIKQRRIGSPFFETAIEWAHSVRAGDILAKNLTPQEAEENIKERFLAMA